MTIFIEPDRKVERFFGFEEAHGALEGPVRFFVQNLIEESGREFFHHQHDLSFIDGIFFHGPGRQDFEEGIGQEIGAHHMIIAFSGRGFGDASGKGQFRVHAAAEIAQDHVAKNRIQRRFRGQGNPEFFLSLADAFLLRFDLERGDFQNVEEMLPADCNLSGTGRLDPEGCRRVRHLYPEFFLLESDFHFERPVQRGIRHSDFPGLFRHEAVGFHVAVFDDRLFFAFPSEDADRFAAPRFQVVAEGDEDGEVSGHGEVDPGGEPDPAAGNVRNHRNVFVAGGEQTDGVLRIFKRRDGEVGILLDGPASRQMVFFAFKGLGKQTFHDGLLFKMIKVQ
ncbi:MAG: hypothetical protein BWY31_04350 [Lentisphaerae bacterium ADurb.Bin242]|nr:MAG: hypothetical protein BWY31_04350 [Lentisphaerae bacterium ADurb.Bin242]